MINQLRIYTINRGAMDEFLTHFHDQTLPLHKKVGIDVTTTLVNRPQNEFIWVRTFADAADRDAKQAAFQQAAKDAGVVLGGTVAKMEIRETEQAFAD
jgi:hypothetical protein